jgi:hypothetical protein
MAPTPTTRVRAQLQEYNTNAEAWGDLLNTTALQLLDDARGQFTTKALTGDYTLDVQNYLPDEARAASIRFTGTGTFTVTAPAVAYWYIIQNDCTGDLTLKPSGGAGAVIRAGTRAVWYTDGTTGYVVDPTLDKVKAPTAAVSLNSQKITNLATPTLTGDAATKGYVDTFTADRAAGGFKLTGLANGAVASQDAAPVAQVEAMIASASVAVPVQTGQAGKYLKTDGSALSWDQIDLSSSDTTGTLPLNRGGTGATAEAAARAALFAAVLSGNGSKQLRVNSGATDIEAFTASTLPGNIVQTVKTDTFTTTSTSFTDVTGLSAAITPTATSSRVKVSGFVSVGPDAFTRCAIQLVRNSTAIGIGDAASSRGRATAAFSVENASYQETVPFEFIDSPATTSSTTYKIQIVTSSGTVAVNRSSSDTDASSHFRTISSIRVEEIAAT